MAETKQVAKRGIIELLKDSAIQSTFKNLFVKNVTADRFFAMVVSAAKACIKNADPNFPVNQDSILLAIYKSAKLGLYPDESLGHAHLVPFKSSQLKQTIITLIPGYRGLIHLARESGKVRDIQSEIVYEKDTGGKGVLVSVSADGKSIKWEPDYMVAERGRKVALIVITTWMDGTHRVDVIPYSKVDKIAKAQIGRTRKVTPWTTNRDEMDIKTGIRYVSKYLPQTPELAEAVASDERLEQGKIDSNIPEELEAVIGVEYKELADKANEEQPEPSGKPEVAMPTEKAPVPGSAPATTKAPEKPPEQPKVYKVKDERQFALDLGIVLPKLKAHGITQQQIDRAMITAGLMVDFHKEDEKNRKKVVDVLYALMGEVAPC